MEVFLGIDLGTTTTLIGRAIEGEKAISVRVLPVKQKDGRGNEKELTYLPSVAYFPPAGDLLVGLEAQNRGPEEDASRYIRAVKRQMGRRLLLPVVNWEPYKVSAAYLAHVLREGRYQLPLADPVFTVTVPASFTTNQRSDTLLALREACAEINLRYPEENEGELFISEPVAAMLAFLNQEFEKPAAVRRLDLSKPSRVVVYDIGGGTLDLTIVYVEPRTTPVRDLEDIDIHVDAIGYYNPFGGEDLDLELAKALYQRLLKQFPELHELKLTPEQRLGVRLQLMNVAKSIKEELSEQMGEIDDDLGFLDESGEEAVYFSKETRILNQLYALEGEITETEYREIIHHLLNNSSRKSLTTSLQDLLKKTKFSPDRLDGLLVVGGAARLPLIPECLRDFWGNERVWVFQPPDHAVVTGAAIYSYLRRRSPGFVLDEPAADAYYVRLKEKFDLILPTNAKDKKGEKKRYELDSEASRLLLQIFAGEEAEAGEPIESIYPSLIHQGGTTINLGQTYPAGTPVWVQMRYAGEPGTDDHSKVPWIYVWVGKEQGEPLFHRRYSDFVQEAQNG